MDWQEDEEIAVVGFVCHVCEMYHIQGTSKQHCRLLAVLCGNFHDRQRGEEKLWPSPSYPIPELVSSGRLEVSVLLWCKNWIFVVVHLLC